MPGADRLVAFPAIPSAPPLVFARLASFPRTSASGSRRLRLWCTQSLIEVSWIRWLRSLLLARLTSEAQSGMKTLWSPSHMHRSLGTFPSEAPIRLTADQTGHRPPAPNPRPPSFLCPQCVNMQLALLTCMHFLPVLSANGYLLPADLREEGRPKQKNRDASRLSFLPLRLDCFALHISSHRGSHDLTFSMWCPILVELLCVQGLCLKARSE